VNCNPNCNPRDRQGRSLSGGSRQRAVLLCCTALGPGRQMQVRVRDMKLDKAEITRIMGVLDEEDPPSDDVVAMAAF
jgi:hypothetical protein